MSDVLGSLPPELTPASRRLVAGFRLATALAVASLAIARLAGRAPPPLDGGWSASCAAVVLLAGALLLLATFSAPFGGALAGLCLAGVAVERILDGAPRSALTALALALAAAIVAVLHRPPALR